nr:hypothetical protein Iba_chr06cCG17050 [Ipomoea batatas]
MPTVQKAVATKHMTDCISRTNHVLLRRLAGGPVAVRAHGEDSGGGGQQHDGVDRERREPLADEHERESRREGELRGEEERRGGDGELRDAVGVHVAVDADHQAHEGGGEEDLGGGLEESGEPDALAAVEEVEAREQWAAALADAQNNAAEDED